MYEHAGIAAVLFVLAMAGGYGSPEAPAEVVKDVTVVVVR